MCNVRTVTRNHGKRNHSPYDPTSIIRHSEELDNGGPHPRVHNVIRRGADGMLKPLADEKMALRLEPIIFVIIGYYFGRLRDNRMSER